MVKLFMMMTFMSLTILLITFTKLKYKLLTLLMLEILFILSMINVSLKFNYSHYFTPVFILVTLFMVLDSVLGMSILIGTTRNSTKINSMLNFF